MKLLLAFLRLEWNHLRRDRMALLWTAGMPFAFMLFFGSVFGERGSPENTRIALRIRDGDGSRMSAGLAALLDSTRFALSRADAASDSTAAPSRRLEIPAGFQDSVLAGRRVDVARVRTRGSEEASIAADAGIVRALVRFHGALALAAPDSSGWTDSSAARWDAALAAAPAVRVDSRWSGTGVAPSGFRQSVPGNLTMFVLMNTVIAASTLLVTEKTSGALRRISAGPISRRRLLACRIVPRFLIAFAQVLLLLGGARLFFGYTPGHDPLAFLAVAAAFALVCVGIGTLLGAMLSTVQQAAMASWISSMLMGSIGGAWWPLEIVPNAMRTAAHLFPTAWAMDGFHAVATRGGGWSEAALPLSGLLAMAEVLLPAAAKLLRVDDR